MRLDFDTPLAAFNLPQVRSVGVADIGRWLHSAWRDLRANPMPAIAYGLLFGIAGDIIILVSLDYPHRVMVAISGFFLVAPLLAAGLYELSRGREMGEDLMFIDSLRAFRRNLLQLALFGLMLALCVLLWERFTAIAFALIGGDSGTLDLLAIIASGEHFAFLATWVAMGLVLALFVFAIGVVAVPLMVDRNCDVAAAMVTSLQAFARNPGTLLLWAGVIVLLTLIGFATLLFGLIVIMPLLGHASWHAYRDLVE